jgi:peptide/nickel transport system substrate-binding protein
MGRRSIVLAAGGLAVVVGLAACGGRSAPTGANSSGTGQTQLTVTTPVPTSEVDKVTWAVYREVESLDPIYAFDYPENTALAAMCETLIRQQPDGTTVPGLASAIDTSNPTSIVFTLRDGVTFWDGKALTPDDVVYSLDRQRDQKLGGFYGTVFANVTDIAATGSNQVTITLKQPDTELLGELSSTPGFIVEKAATEAAGKSFGTPSGGIMCTGNFQFQSWKTGGAVVMTRYDNYWDTSYPRMVKELDIVGAPDEASLTQALKTGEIDGVYPLQLSTLDQLKQDPNLNVYTGPSYATNALILSNPSGTLGDPLVRQALSLAIDRQGIIDATWRGAAQVPHAVVGPGTFGYARDVFQAGYDALPAMTQDLTQAKQLISQAGAQGKPIVIGTSSELAPLQQTADAVKSAAESIGLKATEKSVSAANYINFFTDPKARAGVDGFFTVNYPDYADPLALYAPLAMPNGFSNYFSYDNPSVTKQLTAALSQTDDTKRAQEVVAAQKTITADLPWIPLAIPYTTLIMNKRITGAPSSFQYMFGPWAAQLGGTG